MYLSVFSDELFMDAKQSLPIIKGWGLDYVDFRGRVNGKGIEYQTDEELRELKKQLDDMGLKVGAIQSSLCKVHLPDAQRRREEEEKLEGVIRAADILNCRLVRCFNYWQPHGDADCGNLDVRPDEMNKVLGMFEPIAKRAKEAGLVLAFENCGQTVEEVIALVDALGVPEWGLAWDVSNNINDALAKDEAKKDRLSEVLYNLTESIVIGASLLESFLPETAQKITAQFNTKTREYDELTSFGLYESGTKVTDKPEILFARVDFKEIAPKITEIQAKQKAEYEAELAAQGITEPKAEEKPEEKKDDDSRFIDIEPKAEIVYDDFAKLQFQVGVILKCEEVPKSKKLLCSQVKVGSKVLQIVSGIKKDYSAEEMVGKRVMVLTNLKPATLAGIQSEGMLLCAEDENGELSLMSPEKFMPSGAEIC